VALLSGGAVLLAIATTRGRGRRLDDRLFGVANSGLRHPVLDGLFRGITELGSIWASGAAALTLAAAGRRKTAADALGAAATMWVVGQGLKRVFGRMRPYDAGLPAARRLIGKPSGASWPSSHPAVLLSFVTVAGRDLDVPRSARRALAGAVAAVGASRVYLGVHYPSDVVGGLLLGRAVADLWTHITPPPGPGNSSLLG
jgi:membrane-associated phospholipid phosphatase